MRHWLASILSLCVLLTVQTALAVPNSPIHTPGVSPIPREHVALEQIGAASAPSAPSGLVYYDNTVNATGSYYSGQDGRIVVDDLHGALEGALVSFVVGYVEPVADSLAMLVTFYDNPGGADNPPSTLIAGPYLVTDLPGGAVAASVNVAGGPALGMDVWMAVEFSTNSAGLLLYDPPVTGTSHDYFFAAPPNNYLYFGGDPVANFYLQVEVETVVPVEAATWGGIKRSFLTPDN